MARKNLLADLIDTPSPAPEIKSIPRFSGKDAQASDAAHRRSGAVGAMSRTLEAISAELDAAKEFGASVNRSGQIVEIAPDLIDAAFIADRMALDAERVQALADAIEAHGQQSPILVRPHPADPLRYQAAYGHRRLAAARLLGRKVRAFIRPLSDEELVIAQGQENSAREDLSFIERASFASALAARGFSRALIQSALSVDKTELSRMLSVRAALPDAMVSAIGPARGSGRRRWMDLAAKLEGRAPEITEAVLSQPGFSGLASDDRLACVLAALSQRVAPVAGQPVILRDAEGVALVTLAGRGRNESLRFDGSAAPGFAAYVAGRLAELYQGYRSLDKVEDKKPKSA